MMQFNKRSLTIRSLAITVLCAFLFSFSPKPGGEFYEISVNDKVLIQQHVWKDTSIPTLQLTDNAYSEKDLLKVRYSHCGQIGRSRIISIKDDQSKTLKEWHFPDAAPGTTAVISCKVKEILALQKGGSRLNLYYSCKEMPNGKALAAIVTGNENKASLK